ncbi:GNAT family N-acetyltransferase [Tengunoibacter tsumagoiensis]|uniref:N-acetyltransferase domain-containing protein n=1 Tax=Tengunoibacter tsumagoiensis TaxID=2014871 RepID=A0A402A6H5_9CHLR|nr:GNAT family N-acetyltransferase [Tengunoibacter tsumagoiensis]GCE14732.1 hypothetical protein KTT_45910 [Tengunoibacter tsumagoiensis]
MKKQEIDIQAYSSQHDVAAVAALWQELLGQTWPLNQYRLELVLAGSQPQHFVARSESGRVLGFVATFRRQREGETIGHIGALLVASDQQRRGLGSQLHATALAYLYGTGVTAVQLGSITPRFWCGVPENLPTATAFFRKQGWALGEAEHGDGVVYDLVQDLSTYEIPPRIVQRMQQERITLETCTDANVADVLAFEGHHFPHWLPAYQEAVAMGDRQDLLAARDEQGQVIGTLLLYAPNSHSHRTELIWQGLLGEDAGAMGSVGVAESERGRGIGIALVAYGSAIQRARGVRNCLIDWVELTDFYAKDGYTRWRKYATSWRVLPK